MCGAVRAAPPPAHTPPKCSFMTYTRCKLSNPTLNWTQQSVRLGCCWTTELLLAWQLYFTVLCKHGKIITDWNFRRHLCTSRAEPEAMITHTHTHTHTHTYTCASFLFVCTLKQDSKCFPVKKEFLISRSSWNLV